MENGNAKTNTKEEEVAKDNKEEEKGFWHRIRNGFSSFFGTIGKAVASFLHFSAFRDYMPKMEEFNNWTKEELDYGKELHKERKEMREDRRAFLLHLFGRDKHVQYKDEKYEYYQKHGDRYQKNEGKTSRQATKTEQKEDEVSPGNNKQEGAEQEENSQATKRQGKKELNELYKDIIPDGYEIKGTTQKGNLKIQKKEFHPDHVGEGGVIVSAELLKNDKIGKEQILDALTISEKFAGKSEDRKFANIDKNGFLLATQDDITLVDKNGRPQGVIEANRTILRYYGNRLDVTLPKSPQYAQALGPEVFKWKKIRSLVIDKNIIKMDGAALKGCDKLCLLDTQNANPKIKSMFPSMNNSYDSIKESAEKTSNTGQEHSKDEQPGKRMDEHVADINKWEQPEQTSGDGRKQGDEKILQPRDEEIAL